jgi:hypothetical protein
MRKAAGERPGNRSRTASHNMCFRAIEYLKTKDLKQRIPPCYNAKSVIGGDYSRYTSKPLKDFIFESNKGKDFFFVATKEEAVEKIAKAI